MKKSDSPYKCKQTLGRAVKRKAVIQHLANQAGLTSDRSDRARSRNSSRLSDETVTKVKNFYNSDVASWQSPQKKDVVKTKDGTLVARRFLLMTLKEAHRLFMIETDISISFSKFASLRPSYIKLNRKLPHNVCVCKQHHTFQTWVNVLNEITQSKYPKSTKDSLKMIVCDIDDTACMMKPCDCILSVKNNIMQEKLDMITQPFEMWNDSEKVTVADWTYNDVLEHLVDMLPSFKKHCFTKWSQDKLFFSLKSNITPEMAIVQVDFAQNYLVQEQDATQQFHFTNNTQISIFTALVWLKNKRQSFALVSDVTEHTKFTVFVYVRFLLLWLKEHSEISTVSFFSDGAASQFKQRYWLFLYTQLLKENDLLGDWNFFPTSHGKGVVDGVGGLVKSMVSRAVCSRRSVARNASQFCAIVRDSDTQISCSEITSAEVEKMRPNLQLLLDGVCEIKNLQTIHCVKYRDSGLIEIAENNDSKPELIRIKAIDEISPLTDSPDSEMQITSHGAFCPNDWITAIFDDAWYPGIIRSVSSNHFLEISFLKIVGKNK